MLRDALLRDVARLAGEIGERNLMRPRAYAAAADFIEQSFHDAGYAPLRQPFEVDGVPCANIEAELRGGEEIIIVGAHYDTVFGSPGADDNGTGVAATLAIARALSHAHPARTIRLVAFANEEPPYFESANMGSLRYAQRCRGRGEKIVAMFSLETIGYFSDAPRSQQYPAMLEYLYPSTANFIAFVSNLRSWALLRRSIRIFRRHATIPSQGGALPESVPGIAWSDQWAFWRCGYPALMVTDTALFRNPHYHSASDVPSTLDYDRLARVVEGLTRMIEELASGR
jgi:Zn-dependent M28 family amino/carboxypeptidase